MSLIKKIRVKNFKSLEDVEIEIKPLTFLFGPNSSGKSSFLKAMMFLSKNLFPLNTGKTIYKISDDVDLGSYKEIVTNNDESRNIIFEFDLGGEFDFPKIELLKGDISFLENDPEIELTRKYIDSFEKENFFSAFEKYYYSSSKNKDTDKLFIKNKYELTYKIEFSNFETFYNLTRIEIKDKIQSSEYIYIRKEKLPNDIDGENGMISGEQFQFLNNKNISKLFYHYGYIEDVTLYYGENYPPLFNLSKLNTLSNIKSEEFNININSEFSEDFTISAEWKELSDDSRILFFHEILKFCYLTHRLIPNTLKNFLSYKHLPITREIPKKIYLLDKDDFDPTEYYGLLNVLSVEPYISKSEDIKTNLPNDSKSYESILGKIISTNEKVVPKFTFDFLLNSNEKYEKSLHYCINNYLRKLGFNLFYSIQLKEDIGKLQLIGKDNLLMFMSNASSGLLQVFPIIVCCCLWEQEMFFQKETKNSIKFINKEFEDKMADIDYNPFYSESYKVNFLRINYNSLMIEQPELHLHPKLQSQMADMFSKAISNSNNGNTLIIETHSEHLIRKIQVLIAKGELDKEKVSVWYFDNSDGTTKIKEMIIAPNGFFKEPWPNGFFDDSANLSWELLTANKN